MKEVKEVMLVYGRVGGGERLQTFVRIKEDGSDNVSRQPTRQVLESVPCLYFSLMEETDSTQRSVSPPKVYTNLKQMHQHRIDGNGRKLDLILKVDVSDPEDAVLSKKRNRTCRGIGGKQRMVQLVRGGKDNWKIESMDIDTTVSIDDGQTRAGTEQVEGGKEPKKKRAKMAAASVPPPSLQQQAVLQ